MCCSLTSPISSSDATETQLMTTLDIVMIHVTSLYLTVMLIYLNNLIFLLLHRKKLSLPLSVALEVDVTQATSATSARRNTPSWLKNAPMSVTPIPSNTTQKGEEPNSKDSSAEEKKSKRIKAKTLEITQEQPKESETKPNTNLHDNFNDFLPLAKTASKTMEAMEDVTPINTPRTKNSDHVFNSKKQDEWSRLLPSPQKKLPRAPKGNHDEELEEMEQFINEMTVVTLPPAKSKRK
ncbi:hypothetical protein RB195_016515 [Necator americanus]|uniref:Uncharacterized protein n=1 Tax=Necator americanus TaxID=51031 RepID=A0ABR1C0W0_NECAM